MQGLDELVERVHVFLREQLTGSWAGIQTRTRKNQICVGPHKSSKPTHVGNEPKVVLSPEGRPISGPGGTKWDLGWGI